jgi:outer membrane receptor for ferrienterochelin and colicin
MLFAITGNLESPILLIITGVRRYVTALIGGAFVTVPPNIELMECDVKVITVFKIGVLTSLMASLSLQVQAELIEEKSKEVNEEVGKDNKSYALDPVSITAKVDNLSTTDAVPSSMITAEELQGINFTNVEDAIANEPNLIVRKRYIGDPNGTLGIRSVNMFQTTQSMVFADGLPLHYHLQTQYSGAPRWSVVAPNEVESVEVLYGPF